MSSDEEDYMSENFLLKCLPEKKDIVPGLVKNHSLKRKHMIEKKTEEINMKKKKNLPRHIIEASRREEGLQECIGSSNKGYALMEKMGYQPGKGIGKQKNGMAEPIAITVKNDRFGLGRQSVLKEISEWKTRKRHQKIQQNDKACNIEEYRRRLAEKTQEKNISFDLSKSQKICKTLDLDQGVTEPDETWFWPEVPILEEEDRESDADEGYEEVYFEPSEKLKLLTSYLRECHLYCIWCGTHYEDHDDMTSNCPGSTRDDH